MKYSSKDSKNPNQKKKNCELGIVLTRSVNILTSNELVKLTML